MITPLLVAGISTVAKPIIDNFFPGSHNPVATAGSKSFEAHLKACNSTKQPSELQKVMINQQVGSLQDVESLKKSLSGELLKHPELQGFMNQLKPGTPVSLSMAEDGKTCILTADSGQIRTFSILSEPGKMGLQVAQLNELLSQAAIGPNSDIWALANKVSTENKLTTAQLIRNSAGIPC